MEMVRAALPTKGRNLSKLWEMVKERELQAADHVMQYVGIQLRLNNNNTRY